jgi:cation diffusion facilitator CzcD-associated flavoprotein CzcO
MKHIETDYLVIGSGMAGLAFADTLIDESDAHVTLVDRHGKPGGHWNDAYGFVTLHQPSAFYGVNSMELGNRRIDTAG